MLMQTTTCHTIAEIKMAFMARPEYLCLSRMAVRQVVGALGMDEDKGEAIVLAVVEALTNVIRHGYGGPCDKPIEFQISQAQARDGRRGLEIIIRDYGRQVELEKICSRDLDDVRPGGLGVHIIKSIMDEIEYSHAEECGLRLRMVKFM